MRKIPALFVRVSVGFQMGCGASMPATAQRAPVVVQPPPKEIGGDRAGSARDEPSKVILDEASARASLEAARRLRATLAKLSQSDAFALGNEDSTAYGIGWKGDDNRSDIERVCGAPPAVYGWDLFGIELGHEQNGDSVPFSLMCQRMQAAHRKGGINTVSWHANNPVTGGNAWDRTAAVPMILPGQPQHEHFRGYVDRVADFLLQCRGDHGELLPVIFRPFHEHSGDWFWWGASGATDEQFVKLWQFFVDYLRERRQLQHLLFAYSPDAAHVNNAKDYLRRYPGPNYVDVMGLDHYYEADARHLVRTLEIVVDVAQSQGKWAALTEFGVRDGLGQTKIDTTHWFTQSFLEPLRQSKTARHIVYALAWRNASLEHYFVPYPGAPSAADFRALCADPNVLLLDELKDWN